MGPEADRSSAQEVPGRDRAGEHLTTLALSEPGTGAAFWLPQTLMTQVETGTRADGEKSLVTNG